MNNNQQNALKRSHKTQNENNPKFRKIQTTSNGSSNNPNAKSSCLPQIAIKRKDNDSLSSNNIEVVLLNGNWDTSYKIPNIIAEMHNVNLEEIQALQQSGCGGGNKQMKIESANNSDVLITGSPSSLGSDSGIEADCSDGNLSWLLNYKISELPPVPDCAQIEQNATKPSQNNNHGQGQIVYATNEFRFNSENHPNVTNDYGKQVAAAPPTAAVINNHQPQEPIPAQTNQPYRYSGPKKPPFTYTELIEHALVEKGELTVSGIYQWISDHFPFYKQNDDRWKNSVRHNLSINPHFRKGSKAIHGAGHLWTIAQKEDQKTWNIKKQRLQQFIQTSMNEYSKQKQQDLELATATASILPPETEFINVAQHDIRDSKKIQQPQNVEVEYVIDMSGGLGDFLCPPVTKEQVAEECGLGGDYLITDLNPATLGLNLTDAEIMNGATLYDDLSFQCYGLQTD